MFWSYCRPFCRSMWFVAFAAFMLLAPAALVPDEAATRIATLGGPPVPIADAAAKPPDTKLDRDALNKKLEAERAKERHRLAMRRARLAQQAAAEQAANPFAPHPLIGAPMPVR